MSDKDIKVENENEILSEIESPPSSSPYIFQEHVVFEEYLHYAALQRHAESTVGTPNSDGQVERENEWFKKLSSHKGANIDIDPQRRYPEIPMTEEQEERAAASRSMRLASWASVFYLITTDILGPFNAPFAISQVGWVPGEPRVFSTSEIPALMTYDQEYYYTSLVCRPLFGSGEETTDDISIEQQWQLWHCTLDLSSGVCSSDWIRSDTP